MADRQAVGLQHQTLPPFWHHTPPFRLFTQPGIQVDHFTRKIADFMTSSRAARLQRQLTRKPLGGVHQPPLGLAQLPLDSVYTCTYNDAVTDGVPRGRGNGV
jgi:hypothetical protein